MVKAIPVASVISSAISIIAFAVSNLLVDFETASFDDSNPQLDIIILCITQGVTQLAGLSLVVCNCSV